MPWGIAAGPDGNIWFTEDGAARIGRITTSGVITEFSLAAGVCPYGIVAGPDGNLWFTEYTASVLGRITPSGSISQFTLPTTKSAPEGIAVGPGQTSIWWTEPGAGQVGKLAWLVRGQSNNRDSKDTQFNDFAMGEIDPDNGDEQTDVGL